MYFTLHCVDSTDEKVREVMCLQSEIHNYQQNSHKYKHANINIFLILNNINISI